MPNDSLTKYGMQPWGSGTVDQASGEFTQATAPVASSNLNPYIDPDPWGVVILGGLQVCGIITAIDGHSKPEEWNVQKGTSSSGATTVWKGTKLAEAIKITVALVDAEMFENYYAVRDTLRPKLGTKPPSLTIVNAAINAVGITRVACVDISAPRPAAGLSWSYEITLIEYNPTAPAKAGPAGAAKGGAAGAAGGAAGPTENDKAAAELAAAVEKAKAL